MAEEEKTSKKAKKEEKAKADKKSASAKDSSKKGDKKSKKKNPFKSMGAFFKSVNSERKKVIWPTAKETIKNALVVLLVIAVLGAAIYGVDTLLSLGMKGIKGLSDKETTTVSETTTLASEETTLVEDTTSTTAAE